MLDCEIFTNDYDMQYLVTGVNSFVNFYLIEPDYFIVKKKLEA